jgi:hypothetical protein
MSNVNSTTYNIGDMIVIPFVEKIGIIINIKHKHKYQIFWQYQNGETDTVWEEEKTITFWLSKKQGLNKTIPLNQYYAVPK